MIISILNQKGGVGKTTTSVNLAYGIAQAGKKILLVDIDPQANTSAVYCDDESIRTIREAFEDRKLNISELIQPAQVHGEQVKNMFLLPSSIHLAVTAERIISRPHREKILFNHLKYLLNQYDFILIDCPPNLGSLAINAIYAADLLLIPVTSGKRSLDGIADLFLAVEEIKESENFDYRIVRNEFDGRTQRTNEYINSKLEDYQDKTCKTIIRKSEAINQADIQDEPIFMFDPKGNGSKDFNQLTNEIINYGN